MKERREGTYCPKCRSEILFGEPDYEGRIIVSCLSCDNRFQAKRYMDIALIKIKNKISL